MPKVENIKCKLIGTEKPRIMRLQMEKSEHDIVKKFLLAKALKEREKETEYTINLNMEYATQKRSLQQNKLYWSLMAVFSWEVYQQHGWEEELHEEILRLYAPKVTSKFSGKLISKRSRKMDTKEFALLLEGVFCELSSIGVDIDSGSKIANYWKEWQIWRGSQGVDPLSDTYQDIEDYKFKVPFCEACQHTVYTTAEGGVRLYVGHMAHIVSKGSGGSDELWNRMQLCVDDHLGVQHQKGWVEFIEKYPHQKWKVEKAFEKAGAKMLPAREEARDLEVVK